MTGQNKIKQYTEETIQKGKKDSFFIYVEESNGYSPMLDAMFLDASITSYFSTVYERELMKRWQQLLISGKGQRVTHGKLNWLLEGEYKWEREVCLAAEGYEKVYVLFLNCSFILHRPPYELLLKYKRKYDNIYYILFYIDLTSHKVSQYANYLRNKGIFDLVYTFDHTEAEENGFILRNTPYSVISELCQDEEPAYDLYSCMHIKERKEDILAILEAARRERVDLKMDLVLHEDEEDKYFEAYDNNVSRSISMAIPYREVLKRTLRSNCILEVCLPNQKGMSLRAYEAVVYNKKLLTNNSDITEFPFYDDRFMKYYNCAREIDWDWVKDRDAIDYGYNGIFSPKHLLEDIQRRL